MLGLLLLAFVFYKFLGWLLPPKKHNLNVYFGVPGSGKTTFAAWLTKNSLKEAWPITLGYFMMFHPCRLFPGNWLAHLILESGFWKRRIDVFSNVPITGAYSIDVRGEFGRFDIRNGRLIIDEAGVDFNNRQYKTLPAEVVFALKYHRHAGLAVDVFSQSHEDMDVTFRRLAFRYYLLKKSIWPFCIALKSISRTVGIDDNTHQIIDYYKWGFPVLTTKRIFSPPLWKLFNSYSFPDLPVKAFPKW